MQPDCDCRLCEAARHDWTLTNATRDLLAQGRREDAAQQHNATMDAAFERAKAGAIINLSDLIASSEEFRKP